MEPVIQEREQLKRTLGPFMLWGLGVGYVISGMYFGWNLGLEKGGTAGMAVATFFIIILYLTFTFSYTELACAIPKAGGAFDYAVRGLGRQWGFIAGMAQIIEFVFAPPAIAFAIGAYLNIFLPAIPVELIAILAYVLFTGLNIYGIQAAASFELVITLIAVAGLLIFTGTAMPSISLQHLSNNAWPNGWSGAFAAIPFAVWFFLGIEGVANVAEETINPQRNVLIGFGSAIVTLVILCVMAFIASVGIGGWEAVVYPKPGAPPSDSPLPLALVQIVSTSSWVYKAVGLIGLCGLIASFNGIILASGRATFEFGRLGDAPTFLGKIHDRFKTPSNALLANMVIGIIALLTGKTSDIITISCFGALTLYIISMVALVRLRQTEPNLARPFRVPFYPWFPVIAGFISGLAFLAITVYNLPLAAIYLVLLGGAYGWFRFFYK